MRRIVDLSMPVHAEMLTFPRVPPPALCVYESHTEFAERIGAAEYGVDSLTASYLVVQNDHVGSHCDARKHIVPTAGGPESIPLEYCYSDGVLLDFTHRAPGDIISAADIEEALAKISYEVKERDIVLIHTGAGVLSPVTHIQRINTVGGKAPTTPGARDGQEARVYYTATYVFYKAP